VAALEVIFALRWLHTAFAVGWMGALLFFNIVVGPLLGRLTPSTRSEFLIGLIPRMIRYFGLFAGLTLLVGAVLALVIVDGDLSRFSPANPWGLRISIGAILALIAAGLAVGVVSPTSRKLVRILSESRPPPASGQGPPPGAMAAQRRIRVGSLTALGLLFVVLFFMVWPLAF
jgi:uncharacterized membrane protein